MKQNKLSFESENLVVDWISFKFQSLDNFTKRQIVNYLFKTGFNSYQESGKLAKPIKEPILVSPENKLEALFVTEGPYWQGTILQFSGFNAKNFYNLIKQELVPNKLFTSAILGRLDINYSRKNKISDKTSVIDFFEKCHRKLNETNKNVSLQKNIKGLILKIGNRKSNHYSRIYQGKDFLKFEYEMKGRFLREYHTLLIENNLEEFENKLSKRFLYNFGKTLPLHYFYLDWLVVKLRPIRKQKSYPSALKSHYIQTIDFTSTIDRQQFLVYVWIMKLTP
jgi:hypothetical protein